MTMSKEIVVRLFATESVDEDWDGSEYRTYRLENRFELVSTDIPEEDLSGVGESWAQSDHYYETIQNLVAVFP